MDDVIKDEQYTLKLADGSDFVLTVRNLSNGYYSGWIEVFDFQMKPGWEAAPIVKNHAAQ
eukprot:gene9797-12434_t